MKQNNRLTLLSLAVLLALLFAAAMPLAVFAQDEVPPAGEEEMTVPEVLEALPEDTELVIVDAEGDAIPLASQEAAEAVAFADPKFCPNDDCAGAIVRATIFEAIQDAYASGLSGVIYIEAGTFNEDVQISAGGYASGSVPLSLSIIGAGSGQTIINGQTQISGMKDLTLQGLTLNGQVFVSSENLIINDATLDGIGIFESNIEATNGDLTVKNSTFSRYDEIVFSSKGGKSTVTGNEFKNNSVGLIIEGEAEVSGNVFADNIYGVYGVVLSDYAAGTTQIICNNTFSENVVDIGLWLDSGMVAKIDKTVTYNTFSSAGTIIGCTECLSTGGGTGGGNSFAPTVIIVPVPVPFEEGALPGSLPNGKAFGAGINLTLHLNTALGELVDYAPYGVTVFFEVPESLQGKSLSVLFWDDGKWVTLPVVVNGEMAYFTASRPGAYVLVVNN